MKLHIHEKYERVFQVFTNHYNDYNIIFSGKADDNNYLFVVEKFFFRNSNRASLTAVLTKSETGCKAIVVASGAGQGMIFKFDWGAAGSFERSILSILSRNGIQYSVDN